MDSATRSHERLAIRRRRTWVAGQVAFVASGVAIYFGVRGLTAGSPEVAREHAMDIMALEEQLGLDAELALQGLVINSELLSTLANWIYIWGHWPVIALTLLWLALRHRSHFVRLRNGMVASGLLGLAVYTTYPVAPPRLLDGLGFVDTVTQNSDSYRVLQPPAFVNQYAAMPSLHVGWDLLVGMAIASAAGVGALRWLGRLMPLLMAAAVVVTANHYLLDVGAGVAFALTGHAIAGWVERGVRFPMASGPTLAGVPAQGAATGPPTLGSPAATSPAPEPPLPGPRQPEREEQWTSSGACGGPPM